MKVNYMIGKVNESKLYAVKKVLLFFDGIRRTEELENVMITGNISGSRGKPREMALGGLRQWHEGILVDLIQNTEVCGGSHGLRCLFENQRQRREGTSSIELIRNQWQ